MPISHAVTFKTVIRLVFPVICVVFQGLTSMTLEGCYLYFMYIRYIRCRSNTISYLRKKVLLHTLFRTYIIYNTISTLVFRFLVVD